MYLIRTIHVSYCNLFPVQAVLKQFGAAGYGGSDYANDGAEFQQHQKLERLYMSTRAAKVACSS